MNAKKEPVPFASVTVIDHGDSAKVYKKAADSSGLVSFTLARGQYTARISTVNYQPFEKTFSVNPNQAFFNFFMESLSTTLGNVVIRSQKPLMRQEDDKTIIDPENLAAASTNGYEVLEKTPGLFVDQDGNIYISSLTPATVQINGRELNMSAADVATMLKSLPPNSIAKIEIVRTPSAKYDASTSGGVVNVVLKKGVKIGLTGSINAGMQQGFYGTQFAGISVNNNNGKTSSYINLNFSRRANYERIITDRIFAPDSLLSQDAFTKYPATDYFVSYGMSTPLSKKWDISFDGSLINHDFDNKTDNVSVIQKISTSGLLSNNLNHVNYGGNYLRLTNAVNFKEKLDTAGSEWSTDINYSYDRNRTSQQYVTNYYSPVSATLAGNGSPDNDRNYFTFSTDLKKKFRPRLTLETGLKSTALNYRSAAAYFQQTGSIFLKDANRTNTFHYKENINAAYAQASKTFGKDIILKIGARLENTNMNGLQLVPSDTSFTIHRTDLFPYAFLSKSIMKIEGYQLRAYLVYRRTINRPVYDQLNPFPRYVDPYLSDVGNPSLRPQFTDNYEANISVDERPVFAVGVNNTKDIFTNVIYQADSSQSHAYRTYDNLGKNKEWYLRGLGALPAGGKYFLVVGAQYNHNFYQGLYENQPLSFKRGTWTFFTYQTLKLGKLSQLTVNGFLRLKGQQQFYELTGFGALNSSINRQFLKQKLTVTLSANDIFHTNKNNFSIDQGSVDATGSRIADTQRFGINFRYSFGIRKKEENNMFNLDSPEKSN